MMKIRNLFARIIRKSCRSQEEIRREYEETRYDHYLAFGQAFTNFCRMK